MFVSVRKSVRMDSTVVVITNQQLEVGTIVMFADLGVSVPVVCNPIHSYSSLPYSYNSSKQTKASCENKAMIRIKKQNLLSIPLLAREQSQSTD